MWRDEIDYEEFCRAASAARHIIHADAFASLRLAQHSKVIHC